MNYLNNPDRAGVYKGTTAKGEVYIGQTQNIKGRYEWKFGHIKTDNYETKSVECLFVNDNERIRKLVEAWYILREVERFGGKQYNPKDASGILRYRKNEVCPLVINTILDWRILEQWFTFFGSREEFEKQIKRLDFQ